MEARVRLVVALLALAFPAAGQAQSVERGSTLQRTPYAAPPADGNDCRAQPQPDSGQSPYVFVNNGQPSCSWYQVGVSGAQFDSDPRTGFVGGTGVVTSVSVRAGPNPAPLTFFVGRQITPAVNGNPAGNPQCCFYVTEQGPFQPAQDAISTFPVSLPVENSRTATVISNDFIGFSANANAGTLPLARVPGQDRNLTFGTPGTLNAGGYWPSLGRLSNDTGGGRVAGGYGGIEVLLRYTLSARPGLLSPGPPITFPSLNIVQLGGSVLRPIGRDLDVIIDCLQANCNGALDLITRSRVLPAAKKKTRKIRSLVTKRKFTVKKGKRKVRLKLNKLGRKLARRKSTKVKLVVDLGPGRTVTRNMTLKKAKAKARKKKAKRR